MINNFLDADDTDNADLKGCAIKVDKKNPRYPCHPRLKNNIPNGANHLSPNTNHFYSYLIELAGWMRVIRKEGLVKPVAAADNKINGAFSAYGRIVNQL